MWIVASGTVTVAGTGYIAANGGNGSGYEGGGGSGGSILIQCGTLTGNGSLQARGGDRPTWNGENSSGGGGRIALHYTNWNFQGTINIRGGVASAGWGRAGDPGTLYTSGGEILSTNMFGHGFRYAGAATNWAPASLLMTNAVIWLDRNVTYLQVAGDCLLNHSSELRVFGSEENTNMTLFTVGQDLILTNGSTLYVYSGVTNEGPDGAEVVTVGRDVIIATNCAIYPTSYGSLRLDAQHTEGARYVNPELRYPAWGDPARTNGGSVRFEVGRDLRIHGGGAFNANWRGYAGGFWNFLAPGGNSNEWNLGWGPGAFNNNRGPGAGHGGVGGKSETGLGGGPAYGDMFAPTKPGSGGSVNYKYNEKWFYGGDGGGVVRVKVGREARIDGTVSANGQNASMGGGGGSGGSVWLWCKTLSGKGVITATGGNGASSQGGGGGAGGRIAFWCEQQNNWTGTTSVVGGAGYQGSSTGGEGGTVAWKFYLTTTAGANGMLLEDKSGWYTNGASVMVEALPISGYRFLHWRGDLPVESKTNNPLSLVMDRPYTIEAVFGEDTSFPVTRVWTGGTGGWFNASSWSPAGIPGPEDAVVIQGSGHSVWLDDATWIGSLMVTNGGALIFTNWNSCLTVFNDVLVSNANSRITHAANSDTDWTDGWREDARVWIVCSNLTVTMGGRIDASGMGFRCGVANEGRGRGPGGDPWPWYDWNPQHNGHGASYGGRGGNSYKAYAGPTYGSAVAPTNCGSGGGRRGADGAWGHGGGAVLLQVAGVARIEKGGRILANGNDGGVWSAGGGSGGSIYLTCGTLAGDGLLQAKAGAGGGGGYTPGSGGGRIALHYTDWAWQGTNDVNGSYGVVSFGPGEPGTLYLTGTNLFSSLIVGHKFRYVGAMTNWEPQGLVLSNATLWLDISNLQVRVRGDLVLHNSELRLIGVEGHTVTNILMVDGDLILTNGSRLAVLSGVTNEPPEGAEVVTIGRDLIVATNCTINPVSWFSLRRTAQDPLGATSVDHGLFYDPTVLFPAPNSVAATNGGSPRFEIGRNLHIHGGGTIDASRCGYSGGFYDMSPYNRSWDLVHLGWGPGAIQTNWYDGSGAGHGGAGGKGRYGTGGGPAYGSSNAPVRPGSGGARTDDRRWYDGRPGHGGGLVRLHVGSQARIDGVINADGGFSIAGGGGSGGGIWITCKRFSGTGSLWARGGNRQAYSFGGGGAGGRIAIWYRQWEWNGTPIDTNSVAGGIGYGGSSTAGEVGTVVLQQRYPAGTLMIIK